MLFSITNLSSAEVEKQDKVLKPSSQNLTLVAIYGPYDIKTLLHYWFSGVLCFAIFRTQLNKSQ